METCDICRAEFTASAPQPAVLDAPLVGGGPWAYFCRSHLGNAQQERGTWLAEEEEDRE